MFACLLLAAGPARGESPTPSSVPRTDSIVLVRSPCFGPCPAYRLSIRANGAVTFLPENGENDWQVTTGSIHPGDVAWLLQAARSSGFFALPRVIADDRRLCPQVATDFPTVTVTIYRPESIRVIDYLGCFTRNDVSLAQLRHFERQIDSVAHSDRWIRPVKER